jgi:DNA-binding CsgD family transcriptional regulator
MAEPMQRDGRPARWRRALLASWPPPPGVGLVAICSAASRVTGRALIALAAIVVADSFVFLRINPAAGEVQRVAVPAIVFAAMAFGWGLSNADIAGQLHMNQATVKAHVSRLLVKLNADNRVQIALLVQRAAAPPERPGRPEA